MSGQSPEPGALYVVATPIGNLGDLSPRAREVLAQVSAVLAEDTRRVAKLLAAAGLTQKVLAFHEHNEEQLVGTVIQQLHRGESFALVSDAGTPLLCDPGYRLVRACRQQGIPVWAVPGPSAVVAAVSVSGLPPYPFTFVGFLPPKPAARRRLLAAFATLPHTLVVFLSPHRLQQELRECAEVLGPGREAALLAELTKVHERCLLGALGELATHCGPAKGEFTLVVGPPPPSAAALPAPRHAHELLQSFLEQGLSLAQARRRAANQLGLSHRELYQLLEAWKREA